MLRILKKLYPGAFDGSGYFKLVELAQKLTMFLLCFVLLGSSLSAQDPAPVARPQPIGYTYSPSTKTVTIQWVYYAEYLEKLLALRNTEIVTLRATQAQAPVDLSGVIARLDAIKAALANARVYVDAGTALKTGTTQRLNASPTGFVWKWTKNGTVITGQTAESITLQNVSASDAGTYVAEATIEGKQYMGSQVITVLP